jgi:CBS domain-containing protein
MSTRQGKRSVDTLKVGDIMAKEVWTVTPDTTVGDLIRTLSDEQISGVPVVTKAGRLSGVVSVTDILRLAADEPIGTVEESTWEEAWDELEQDGEDDVGTVPQSYYLDSGAGQSFMFRPGADLLRLLPFADHTVEDIMTPATFTVSPKDSVRDLARFLARGRIHRALVVEDGKLVGIVTAFDVVRAIAR